MYTTCLHCHSPLGQNDAVEHFAVGQRLAFDAAKGRLWVVCGGCRRWNLTPLEERWEAIEDCERLFSATRTRVASHNIALARHSSGFDLIRVGTPRFSEFAGWRYGASLHHRWKTRAVPWSLAGFAGYGFQVAMTVGTIGFATAMPGIGVVGGAIALVEWRRGRVRVRLPDGQVVTVRHSTGQEVRLAPDEEHGWALRMAGDSGIIATGTYATHGLRGVLTAANFFVGRRADIADATTMLAGAKDPRRFLADVAATSATHNLPNIGALPPDVRLALEMALSEDAERAAMEGELRALRDEWQLADEIAQIADDLLLPAAVLRRLTRLRGGSGG